VPPSEWAVVWLAVGAISFALMALIQLGTVVALLKLVMEGQKTLRGLQAQVAPLIDRGQGLITSAGDVVHQAHGVVSNIAGQVRRVEGAVAVAADGVSEASQSVRHATARAGNVFSSVRAALLAGIRAAVKGVDERAHENLR
jgi:uncharacterized protein YoxC